MAERIRYRVGDLRAAGLEARWSKLRHGSPVIIARDPAAKYPHQRERWWVVERDMFAAMQRDGVREAFDNFTLLGGLLWVGAS